MGEKRHHEEAQTKKRGKDDARSISRSLGPKRPAEQHRFPPRR